MSRATTYHAYRPSQIEWLSKVPNHWVTTRVKHVARFTTGWTPPTGDESSFDGENLWANISDLGPRVIESTAKRISDNAVAVSGLPISPRGSLLFSFKLSVGQVSFAGRDMYTNEAIATFLPTPFARLDYLYYALPFFVSKNAVENIYGAKLLNQELIRSAPIVLPTNNEQRAIAAFLDRETARIDALIEKKRRLIELLQEKRVTLTFTAVTKGPRGSAAVSAGLESRRKLVSSGVGWAGDVPSHWEVGNLRRFAAMKTGHTPNRNEPGYWEECDIPWFTLADVWQLRDGRRTWLGETKERISRIGLANSAAELLPAGTVVFSRTASVGFSGVMPVPMATTQDFWNWIPGPKLVPEYLLYQFRAMTQEFERLTMGSTHKTIYQAQAAGIRVCVPPLEEQRAIVDFIQRESAKIDELVDRVEHVSALLKEFRSALIAAAVTGELDVREAA